MEYVLCPNKQVCSQKYPSSSLFPRKYLPTLNTYQYVPTILTQVSTCTLRRRKEGWFAKRSVMIHYEEIAPSLWPSFLLKLLTFFCGILSVCRQIVCMFFSHNNGSAPPSISHSTQWSTVVLIILSEIRFFVIQELLWQLTN